MRTTIPQPASGGEDGEEEGEWNENRGRAEGEERVRKKAGMKEMGR